jgi:FtsZ-binding cell division protein ZapB
MSGLFFRSKGQSLNSATKKTVLINKHLELKEPDVEILDMDEEQLWTYLENNCESTQIFDTIQLCHKVFDDLNELNIILQTRNDDLKHKNRELKNRKNEIKEPSISILDMNEKQLSNYFSKYPNYNFIYETIINLKAENEFLKTDSIKLKKCENEITYIKNKVGSKFFKSLTNRQLSIKVE